MYNPKPQEIELPPEVSPALIEIIAESIHEKWARSRLDEGWAYGSERNDELKTTPCLVPYDQLPEIEKDYDRNTARETLKVIYSLGYKIVVK